VSFRYNDLPANRTVLWREGVPINLRALHEHFFIRPLADHFFLTHPTVFDTRYAQDHLPVRERSAAVGHAVRVLYSGMADVAYESGDPQLIAALHRLHDSVTLRRMYVTGGIGPSSKNEGFTDDYDLPNENAYQETCASAGMVLWNYRMFKLTGDGGYVDLLEQSLYNAVLAGSRSRATPFAMLLRSPATPNSGASLGSKFPAALPPRRAFSRPSGVISTASLPTAFG